MEKVNLAEKFSLFEPASTLNTGNVNDERTKEQSEWV